MNGTKWQEINSFSPEEICTIIEASARAGVSNFQYRGLELTFGAHTSGVYGNTLPYSGMDTIPPQSGEIDKEQPQMELTEEDKVRLEEAENLSVAIHDPVFFEEMVIDNLLDEQGNTDGQKEKDDPRRAQYSLHGK